MNSFFLSASIFQWIGLGIEAIGDATLHIVPGNWSTGHTERHQGRYEKNSSKYENTTEVDVLSLSRVQSRIHHSNLYSRNKYKILLL